MKTFGWQCGCIGILTTLIATSALAQVPTGTPDSGPVLAASAPATAGADESTQGTYVVLGIPGPRLGVEPDYSDRRAPFWPDLSPATLGWFAAVAILALLFRPRPLVSLRNVDALVLAGLGPLLALREDTSPAALGQTCQWWVYIGLTAAAAYWLVRGIGLLLARRTMWREDPAPRGALAILLIVGLVLSVHQIATAPLSAGSHDGILGGLYTIATGKLPCGEPDVPDGRSPLLYLVHAAALRVAEPTIVLDESVAPTGMTWHNRELWQTGKWWEESDLAAERLVNVVLFIALLLGLYVLGNRLHSPAAGGLMVAVLCLLPATRECLPHPEIMLPTVLVTWAVALALLPVLGGLLGTFCLVLAGVAWPWAWLGLPVMLGFCWRRTWHGLGSVLGLAGGLALIGLGLLHLVQPTIPRATAALTLAGAPPTYEVRLAAEGTLTVHRREPPAEQSQPRVLTRWLWQALVNAESVSLRRAMELSPSLRIDWPNDLNETAVLFRQVDPNPAAQAALLPSYRTCVAELPPADRLAVALRTVLEAVWMPRVAPSPLIPESWAVWTHAAAGAWQEAGWVVNARRGVKLAAGLLTIWAAFAVFFGNRARPRHLVGAMLIPVAAGLIASAQGAAANLVWLAPLVTALLIAQDSAEPEPIVVGATAAGPAADLGPEPRITVNR